MVKKDRRQKVARQLAKLAAQTSNEEPNRLDKQGPASDDADQGPLNLSKSSKRRLVKKLQFQHKLEATHKSLAAKKVIGKKRKGDVGLALGSLGALASVLPEAGDLESNDRKQAKILRSKAKQDIAKKEVAQLAAVLAHPSFKENPYKTIHQHLQNTLPKPELVAPPERKPEPGSRKKKRKKEKARLELAIDAMAS